MSLHLARLRNYLIDHTPLQQYWIKTYRREATHYIGYHHPPNAKDYPLICYVPVKSQLGLDLFDHHRVSLVVGVHESKMEDHIFVGVIRLNTIVQLIVNALHEYENNDGDYIDGGFEVITDLGGQHPFYESEIQFNFILRRK